MQHEPLSRLAYYAYHLPLICGLAITGPGVAFAYSEGMFSVAYQAILVASVTAAVFYWDRYDRSRFRQLLNTIALVTLFMLQFDLHAKEFPERQSGILHSTCNFLTLSVIWLLLPGPWMSKSSTVMPEQRVTLFIESDVHRPRTDGSMPTSVYLYRGQLGADETLYDVIDQCELLASEREPGRRITADAIDTLEKGLRSCGLAVERVVVTNG